MLKVLSLTAFVLTVAVTTPSFAGGFGDVSNDAVAACTPDVYRLCGQFIPDREAITTCLKVHKAKLSSGCRKVFSDK